MIERIIQFSIKNKFSIGIFVVALLGWGTYSLIRLPIDAIPDITNNQVQVISIAPSLAVQEVESFITAPIEVSVANIPHITELRSISRLGLSVVTVVFKDNVDVYWARQQLTERLKEAEESIPPGVAKIGLAPISTGLGEIYQYRLAVDKGYENNYTPEDLRTLQDWTVRREMLGTPGVADVNSYGGFVKQYEVAVNPDRLRSMNLCINDIFDALQQNNENTGSAYIDKNPAAYFIRGIGLVKSLDDVGRIVVKNTSSGAPVLIRDVANVQFGNATRYGAFVVDTTEAVGGVVMMLKGANAHEVIKNVEKRVETIQKTLPKGVTIEPYLNRSDLVGRAIGTVSRNLIEGALIVIFILVLFLGNLRSGLIVASVIPLSMLFAVSMMHIFGVSGNLMSLGAIDFGLIVDGAVIIIESVVHRLSDIHRNNPEIKRFSQQEMDENVMASAKQMMNTATFGQIIILIVYIPIMALAGIEGKMFRPMAQVVTFALIGAAILSLTYVPMISALFLSRKAEHKPNFSDKLMSFLQKIFKPAMLFTFRHKLIVSGSAILLFIVSLFIFSNLGGEFIPQLEEGDLASDVITLQGGSLTHTIEQVKKANKILLSQFPELKHAVGKIGSGEIPTDPTPMETGDYIFILKPKSEWTSAKTREELVSKMEEALIPLAGVKFEFQQPIQMRFNELLSGSKQDVAVKIFGDNLNTLADEAEKVAGILQRIDGVTDISVEKVTGLAQIQVEYDRERLAQYGLSIGELNRVLRAAFAGSEAGTVYEGEKRFDLVVRLDKDYRRNVDDVKNLPIALPNGGQITFDQVAGIEIKSGPAQVSREDTKRRILVAFNVRNRDIESVIKDVENRIDSQIKLPPGYYISYGGQFQNLEAAKSRLAIAVPVALLLIFILLFFTFHSLKETLLIYTTVPMSVIGGIFALWLRGMNFSISAGVGFVALFGIAVLNGIVLIAEFNRLEKSGVTDIYHRVATGLQTRLRPVVMTASVASLGFLPMALSTSAGAEVQRPLATVVIGGLIIATFLTLLVLPVFYIFFSTTSFSKLFKNKSIMRRKFFFFTIIIPIAALSLISCHSATKAIEVEVENLPEDIVELRSDQIELAGIKLGPVEMRSLSGTIRVTGTISAAPQNTAEVGAPLGGFIKSTSLLPGSSVTQGQSLAVIENPDFIDIQQNYLEAKSKLEYIEADYNRQTELHKDNVTSTKNIQQIASEYKSLKVQIKALEQKLILIGINPSHLNENNISRTAALTSPITGVVKTVNVSIGKSVSPADVLFEIVNTNQLILQLSLFEKDAGKISVGQKVRFSVNNDPEIFEASVYQTAKSIDADKTYKVYATIRNAAKGVLPGMYVKAYIESPANEVASLPADAIVNFDDKDYIFVFEKDKEENGKPFTEYRMIEVQKGVTNDEFIEVILPEGVDAKSLKAVVKGAYNLLSAKKNAGEMSC
jgi:cobalt-zinc-cadmium resistance protein CzcA